MTLDPTSSWDAVLYVRSNCSSASDVACIDDGSSGALESVTYWASAGTTYFAVVDGYVSGSHGPFQLDVSIAPETPDEKCPGQAASWSGTDPLTFSANGDTTQRWPDHTGASCSTGTAAESVYALTAPSEGILSVAMDPTSSWDAALYVRQGTCTSGTLLACVDDGIGGGIEKFELWATSGQTYYVFADGYTTGEGPFTLDAQLWPEKPEEKCPGMDLALSGSPLAASTSGDLAKRWPDVNGTCTSPGRDAVYHVVAPQDGTLNVSVVPSGFDAVVYVRSGSCSGAQVKCQDTGSSGGTESTSFAVTANGEYWIFVDGYSATSTGTYVLSVSY